MKVTIAHFLVSIILIMLFLCLLNKVNGMAANVPPADLVAVLRPGRYTGEGKYAPTDHYPNGLNAKLYMTVTKTQTGLDTSVQVEAFDAVTGNIAYNGVRNATFDYKPNHGDNVFKNSKSFIGGKLVSSSHGTLTSSSKDKLVISSSGSWHTSSYEHNIINTIKKDGDKLYATFDNTGIIPFLHSHIMDEVYTYQY